MKRKKRKIIYILYYLVTFMLGFIISKMMR